MNNTEKRAISKGININGILIRSFLEKIKMMETCDYTWYRNSCYDNIDAIKSGLFEITTGVCFPQQTIDTLVSELMFPIINTVSTDYRTKQKQRFQYKDILRFNSVKKSFIKDLSERLMCNDNIGKEQILVLYKLYRLILSVQENYVLAIMLDPYIFTTLTNIMLFFPKHRYHYGLEHCVKKYSMFLTMVYGQIGKYSFDNPNYMFITSLYLRYAGNLKTALDNLSIHDTTGFHFLTDSKHTFVDLNELSKDDYLYSYKSRCLKLFIYFYEHGCIEHTDENPFYLFDNIPMLNINYKFNSSTRHVCYGNNKLICFKPE